MAKSNEKPVDRGAIALVGKFAVAIGLPKKVEKEFPEPARTLELPRRRMCGP